MSKMKFKKNNDVQETKIEKKLKKIISARLKRKKNSSYFSHEELYNIMVEDAVTLIEYFWEVICKHSNDLLRNVEDVVTISAYDVFTVSNSFELYANEGDRVVNPRTRRPCFFYDFTFKDIKEVNKYVDDVEKRLPAGTIINVNENFTDLSLSYTFKLRIRLKS